MDKPKSAKGLKKKQRGKRRGPPPAHPAKDIVKEGKGSNVVVSMQKELTIELIQANELKQLDRYGFLLNLMLAAFVGFGVAFFQELGCKRFDLWLMIAGIVFAGLFVLVLIWFLRLRRRIYAKNSRVKIFTRPLR